MPRILLITLLALLFGFSCSSQNLAPPDKVTDGLTEEQYNLLLQHTEPFPDSTELSMALLTDDAVTFVGIRKIAGDLHSVQNSRHLFEIGSITKVFTAGLLSQMVSDNRLNLNDSVAALLPVAMRRPAQNDTAMTLLHLANHTSGLPRMPNNFFPSNPADPFADYDENALRVYLQHQQSLVSTPGGQYAYSNLGFGLLGYLLTQQSKTDYASLLHQHVTEPLGMRNTFTIVPPDLVEQVVLGRDVAGKTTQNWNIDVLAGAGAIKSSAHDMSRWLHANMYDTVATHGLWNRCQSPTFTVDEATSLGLGWHILNQDGRQVHWHNGGTGGYTAHASFDRQRMTGVVILSNVSAFSPHMNHIDQLGFGILPTLSQP